MPRCTPPTAETDLAPEPEADGPDGLAPLPCAGALLARTVALMTHHADPCPHGTRPGGPAAENQRDMAREVVANLFFLSRHPGLGPALREVMAQAHPRWVNVVRKSMAANACPQTGAGCSASVH